MRAKQANHIPVGGKADYVNGMFASIAHRYDLLNDILSFRRHYAWRRAAVRMANLHPGDRALDVCAGTGDFAVELYRAVGPQGYVAAADFCLPMLEYGRHKLQRAAHGAIHLAVADTLRLPYRQAQFDCVTVGFGIRNVTDTARGIAEMARVTKSGGRVVCLEFNRPTNRLFRAVVESYQRYLLPRIGGMLSRRDAYTYLPESIQAFYSREQLTEFMKQAGLVDVRVRDLNFGSVCIHIGTKR